MMWSAAPNDTKNKPTNSFINTLLLITTLLCLNSSCSTLYGAETVLLMLVSLLCVSSIFLFFCTFVFLVFYFLVYMYARYCTCTAFVAVTKV